MRFEFATATRVVFGAGVRAELPGLAAQLGHRALVVTGRSANRARPFVTALEQHGVSCVEVRVAGEPSIEEVRRGVALARHAGRDLIVAVGGGSAIDTGKAIAAILSNGGDPLDYLEVIGGGRPLAQPSAPFIAIPTTAGTGAEVTRNAVLSSAADRLKVSLRNAQMLPRIALVDPELTYTLPPFVTAHTGLDALAQLIEPYLSIRANPLTDGFCVEGIPRVARSLARAFHNGADTEARTDMALASLLGGLALANAGLGAVHGFAAPVGGMFHAPHGAVCAGLLPHVMRVNVKALQQRQPGGAGLARADHVAQLLTGDRAAVADDGVAWLQRLCDELDIHPLGAFGVTSADVAALVEQARRASSMRGNPVELTDDELREILLGAL